MRAIDLRTSAGDRVNSSTFASVKRAAGISVTSPISDFVDTGGILVSNDVSKAEVLASSMQEVYCSGGDPIDDSFRRLVSEVVEVIDHRSPFVDFSGVLLQIALL